MNIFRDFAERVLWLFTIVSLWTVSIQASGNDVFEKEFFSVVEITKRIELPLSTSGITQSQKDELLAARRVVVDFLMSLKKADKNPMAYLTPDLKQKYKTRVLLHKEEFGHEAYLSAQFFDFSIEKEHEKIALRFLLTGTREGTDCTYQRRFILTNTSQGWKISSLS